MIEEIEYPLPTIQEYIRDRRISKRIRKEMNTRITEFDVFFNRDTYLIDELSKRCDISREFAEKLLIVFFEEIKKNILAGNLVILSGFGKFYINGPHKHSDGKTKLPDMQGRFVPKFKAAFSIKKVIALLEKMSNEE